MSKKPYENPIDLTIKWVHTEVSDSTLTDEESMIKSLNTKKTKIASFKTGPRFLIIGSTDETEPYLNVQLIAILEVFLNLDFSAMYQLR